MVSFAASARHALGVIASPDAFKSFRKRSAASKSAKSEFAEYDDSITRRYVERITVVDAETIRIKFRYTDVEIDRAVKK